MSRQRWFCIVWALTLVWMPFGACAQELQEVDQAYIARLMDDLRSSSFAAALAAQDALAEIGDPTVPQLRILLNRSQDRMEKTKAIYVLGRIGTEASIRAMLSAASDPDQNVRSAIVTAAKIWIGASKDGGADLCRVPDQRSSRGKGHSCPGSAGDGNIQGGLGGGLG